MLNNVNLSSEVSPYYASLWWKDICGLEGWVDSTNWLEDVMVRRIGNGMLTRFWKDVWIGDVPLCIRFPRLYSISLQKDEYVGVLSEVVGERRNWRWSWRRNLFQWEVERLEQLETFLQNVRLSNDIDDWRWSINPEEGFSVKSAYDLLVGFGDSPNVGSYEMKIFSKIWESSAPSKLVVFSWQLFHNRLPTKDNLLRRGVLDQDVSGNCVWCDSSPESAKHLFAHCWFVHRVWYEIFNWLGVLMVMPHNLMTLFDCFCASVYKKKSKRGFLLVWHTVVWSIWRARNNAIFNGIVIEPMELVEEIKVLSWRWSMDCLKISPCLFYEWTWDPGACFLC
ncbi:hypothetical protein QL285_041620 [Trifolium repens]|nr:hypothetical protein QL285_041620 [Trifolium repens]